MYLKFDIYTYPSTWCRVPWAQVIALNVSLLNKYEEHMDMGTNYQTNGLHGCLIIRNIDVLVDVIYFLFLHNALHRILALTVFIVQHDHPFRHIMIASNSHIHFGRHCSHLSLIFH